jgi:NADH-quinone oxidoreductase subunit B
MDHFDGCMRLSGGMFDNYWAIVQGVDHIVPVDIYLPSCPLRPEMLLDTMLKPHGTIQSWV